MVLSAFGGTRGTDRHCGGTTGEPGSGSSSVMLTVGGAEDREAGQYAAPQLFISSSLTLTGPLRR